MTGPNGQKSHGWWRFLVIEEPHFLEFEDGFADEAGVRDPSMPMIRARVELVFFRSLSGPPWGGEKWGLARPGACRFLLDAVRS
jgi:hypothetical protein